MLLMITVVKVVLITRLVVLVLTVEVLGVVDDYSGKGGVDNKVGGPSVNSGGFRCC